MSGVMKFLKSLVTDTTTSKVVSKIPDAPSASILSEPTIVKTVKPHVPLIKFRKGAPVTGSHFVSADLPPSSGVIGRSSQPRGVIEDYQLPLKYRRSPLDEKEIDYINRGGPE